MSSLTADKLCFALPRHLKRIQCLFQREKKGLLKLLSNKKKLRPSPPSSPTLEAEPPVAMDMPQGAVGAEMAPPTSVVIAIGNNCRACPVESELSVSSSSSSTEAASHRSTSQDNTAPIAPPPRQPCSSLLSVNHDGRPIVCERYSIPLLKTSVTFFSKGYRLTLHF